MCTQHSGSALRELLLQSHDKIINNILRSQEMKFAFCEKRSEMLSRSTETRAETPEVAPPHMFSQKDAESLRDWDLSRTPRLFPFPRNPSAYNLIRGSTRCSVCSFVRRGSERALLARAWRRWHAASLRVLGGFPKPRPRKKNRVNAGSRNKYHSSAAQYRDTASNLIQKHSHSFFEKNHTLAFFLSRVFLLSAV